MDYFRGDGSGGARGAQGAQSILITSSESVSSYSIVTWCWLTSWILTQITRLAVQNYKILSRFYSCHYGKAVVFGFLGFKKKKRVGDPEERCHVITYTQEQSGQNWIDWHCEAVYSNKWKKKEIFWNSTNERITSKIYYHIFWFFSLWVNYKYFLLNIPTIKVLVH